MFNSGIRGRRSRDVEGITNPQTKFVQTAYPQPYISGYSVTGLDDTALDVAGGQTVIVTGTGFATGVSATLGGTQIGAVSLVSPTQISFTAPAKSAGTYSLVVYNSTGGAAILVPGITYSSFPTFTTAAGTLGSVYETKPINTSVVATSDSAITYTLASGSLPTGATLSSSGVITGTAPVDAGSTTYTFSIKATDAELQDVTRTFTLTVNTDVVTWVTPSNGATINLDGSVYSQALSATDAASYAVSYTANALPTGLTLSSGTISGTPTVEGTSSTLLTATAATTTRSATNTITWVVSLGDAYWKYSSVLLSAAANTQPAVNFNADSSLNNSQLTVFGDARAQSFHPYQPGYYSLYFATRTDYLSVPATTALTTFPGDFTFEAWVYPTDTSVSYWGIWDSRQTGGTATSTVINIAQLASPVTGQGRLVYYNGSYNYGTGIVYYNQWSHVAIVRIGSTMTFYINGVAGGTATVSGTQTGTASSNPIYIGCKDTGVSGQYGTIGYISNFRIVNGTGVYSANFTPQTTPLLPITNTVLLTGQSNRFIDTSPINATFTAAGTLKVSPAAPFTTQYVPSTQYYSTFFNGSSDLVTVTPGTFGSNDFTIEMWVYSTVSTAQIYFNNFRWYNGLTPGSMAIGYDGTNFYVNCYTGAGSAYDGAPGASITKAGTILNTWHHIAVVRQGTTLYLCVDGIATTATLSSNTGLNLESRTSYWIGGYGDNQGGPGWWMSGFISNFRIAKSQALYTGNFTPSAAPLTKTTIGASGTNVAGSLTGTVNFLTFQSPTIVDNSNDARALTLTTTLKQLQTSPFLPTGYNFSNYFNGSTDYLLLPLNSNLAFPGDYTIEAWVCLNTVTGSQGVYSSIDNSGDSWQGPYLSFSGTSFLATSYISGPDTITHQNAVAVGQWYHIAMCRSGSTTKSYLNGVQSTSTTTSTYSLTQSGSTIGSAYPGSTPFNGYISNLRIIKGQALYTGNFTPATAPLTTSSVGTTGANVAASVTGTVVLLTCQSQYFVDSSTNALTLTQNGTPKIAAIAPFTQPTGYSGTTIPTTYGSGYFDGAGDYLSLAYSPTHATLPSDFTLEFWFYTTTTSGTQALVSHRNANSGVAAYVPFLVWIATGTLTLYVSSNNSSWDIVNAASLGTIVINQWYHFAYSRSSGTVKIYLNGTQVYTFATAATYTTAQPLQIGMTGPGETNDGFNGYICDVRFVKGTGVYTASFANGTSPLTNITNTQLLTLQTNGAHNNSTFIDNSGFNYVITRNGNTNVGTFGPYGDNWSVYFDGSSYLTTASNSLPASGQFTIEAWIFTPVSAAIQVIYSQYLSSDSGRVHFTIDNNSGYKLSIGHGTASTVYGNTVVPVNQWNHVAWTRDSSNTVRIFLNGALDGSATSYTATFYQGNPRISGFSGVGTYNYTGYISNFKISNTALYTSAFTPSISPLTYSTSTVLLTNQSARFIDNSFNNQAITTSGAPSIQKFSPFAAITVPKYYSTYIPGSGDYLSIPNNAAFNFGTSDFTFECWANHSSVGQIQTMVSNYTGAANGWGLQWRSDTTRLDFFLGDTQLIYYTFTPTVGTWYHYAVTRSGTSLKMFINGAVVATVTDSTNLTSSGATYIGNLNNANSQYTYGYLSNVRLVKGTALYTSAFTPSTSPLTTTSQGATASQVSLLTCQSNTNIDNSPNNFTITQLASSAKILAVSPFTPVANSKTSYSPATLGGSYYFDGSGDYLSLASGPLSITSNFTIEAWVYPTSTNDATVFYLGGDSATYAGLRFGYAGYFYLLSTGSTGSWAVNSSTTMQSASNKTNTWYHIALTRNGTAGVVYVNGTSAYTFTWPSTLMAGTLNYIGMANSSTLPWNGYITDARIVNGAVLYPANFYPGPTPLIASPTVGTSTYNASFLLNGTSGGIIDQTRTINFETVGDAKVTPFSPYNGSYYSALFNGSSDYLTMPTNAAFAFGTGDFTIEMWMYPTANQTAYSRYFGTGATVGDVSFDQQTTGLNPTFNDNNTVFITSSIALTLASWNHLAVTRSGTSLKMFVNGAVAGSATNSTSFTCSGTPIIGRNPSSGAYNTGYYSNVRVVKGTAVYTAAFTPSTTPLTAISGTSLLTCQSNKFVDNSTNAFTITLGGTPKVQTQNPFQINTGISYYFDGTGDYLSAPSSPSFGFGTGDFTLETWAFPMSSASNQFIFGGTTSGTFFLRFGQSGGTTFHGLQVGRTLIANDSFTAYTFTINSWYHIAVTRQTGTMKLFVNGTQIASFSNPNDLGSTATPRIGTTETNTEYFTGYFSDFRITKGVARTITVPTLPVKNN